MITYKCCADVDKEVVFHAFCDGFSDYIIKLETTESPFFERFFGAEGNSLEHSFIAIEEGRGVGLILGGIRDFDGIRTMRCGTMCVSPLHRKKGIAAQLLKLHKNIAIEKECKQLFLEVITSNDVAISFYEANGYFKVYDIAYYSTEKVDFFYGERTELIEEISIEELRLFRNAFCELHINWQNEIDYITQTQAKIFGFKDSNKLVGAISINKGAIQFLGVGKEYRRKGIAKALIKKCVDMKESKIRVSFSNNSSLELYLRKMKFTREPIAQYEMYCNL
ncbi:GNAT family N-acetyltransferase [Clostridium sp. CS001]|uniref:GNAT family N-acetyltransferase n=1 Tax=Clostridium sp. CS001 TaxID=2880648 RepID=UPI001CF0F927|nr:GNAT family N-acetyltransferase [Clostridium sp. CS001]MCB2289107.1 GNAT family N-acetyltransferase [Clostridium sp. CS001]